MKLSSMNNGGLFWLCLLAHLARCGEAFFFFRNDDVKVINEGTEEAIPVTITDATIAVDGIKVTNEGAGEAIPVSITEATVTVGVSASTPLPIEQRTPLAISGEWTTAGLAISPSTFIIHDLFFFVESDTSPPCQYSMNFVVDQVSMEQN